MAIIFVVLICLDICWHIWEYQARKHLEKSWEVLFNDKIESDQQWIKFFADIVKTKETTND